MFKHRDIWWLVALTGLAFGCDGKDVTDIANPGGAGGDAAAGSGGAGTGGTTGAGTGGADTGGTTGAGTGGQAAAGAPATAGVGGAAGEVCTYQGIGAADPRPVALDCESMDPNNFTYTETQLCVGETHAAFLAGHCGSSPLCSDYGDWGDIAASVDASFGTVVSAIPAGCDALGVEVIIELAPNASTGTLTIAGQVVGFEDCHGQDVTCPVEETVYDLDVADSDCADPRQWYCGIETESQLDLVLGAAGAGGAAP